MLFFIRRFSLTDLKQKKTTIRRRAIFKIILIMICKRTYETKHIDTTDAGNFENENSCKEGYSYAIIEEWINGNEKYSDVSCWKIHPDGTFEFLKTVILVIAYMCSMEHLISQNMTILFVRC